MKTTCIETGKLFKVTVSEELVSRGYGYCGDDVPPTSGEAIVCSERYTLVLARIDDMDEDGNLMFDDDLVSDPGVTAEHLKWELGDWDSDGSVTMVLAAAGANGDDDVFAVTA